MQNTNSVKKVPFLELKDVVIIVVIFLGAVILRLPPLLYDRFIFLLDAARDFMLIDQLLETKKLMLIGGRSGIQGIFHGPLWLYLITPLFMVLRGNPHYIVAASIVLHTLLLVIISYLLAKHFFNRTFAIIFTLVSASSYGFIIHMHNISNAHMLPIVFTVFLFAGISYMRGNQRALIWQALMTGLAIHFEAAFAVFMPILVISQVIISKRLPSPKSIIAAIVVFVFAISNYILFEVRHAFLMSHTILNLVTGKLKPASGNEHLQNIGVRLLDRAQGFFDYFARPLPISHIIVSVAVFVFTVWAVITLLHKLKASTAKKELLWLALIPLLYYIVYMAYNQILWGHYSFGLFSSAALTFTFVLYQFKTHLPQYARMVTITYGVWICTLVIAFINVPITIASKTDREYANQYDAVQYVLKDAPAGPIHYFVYDPGQLTYKMDYLITYAARKSKRQIDNQKQSVIYLFLYPPPSWNPGGAVWWKENVINTKGTILEERNFGNVVTVQKVQVDPTEPPIQDIYMQNLIFR